ncbi:MAG: hypothetical protein ACK5E3_14210 [Planctomycetota bacterium]|jgi:hypothetical protein
MEINKIIIVFLAALFLGCSKGDFPTAKVEGVVLCEGKPVAAASVYFEPLQTPEKKMIVGKQGFAFTDENGKFRISTYFPGQNDGAVVGKHRVRVGRGDAKCNCSMNEEKDLMQVEVKEGQVNTFELVLAPASAEQLDKEKKDRILQGVDEDGS